jgi:hypothetical protein
MTTSAISAAAAGAPAAIPVVRWPGAHEERRRLAGASRPRVLAIPANAPPPLLTDDFEDWVRDPIDAAELLLRQRTLHERWLDRRGDVWLDEHGLVHLDDRWVALSDAQAAIAAPLIADIGRVARRQDVRRAYEAVVGERTEQAFNAVLGRLRTKFTELDVVLHGLSGGRLLLEVRSSST